MLQQKSSPFGVLSQLLGASNRRELVTKVSTLISFILIVLGAFGLVFLQKPLRDESQDLRNQAAVANGQVLVTTIQTAPQSSSLTIPLNQATTIALQANTNGVQTDGIQVVFNIITDSIATVPQIQVASGAGLQTAYQEIQQTSDGFLVSAIYLPQTIGGTFATTTATTFATISFTPTSTGPITFNYDVDNSISTVHSSNPPRDELRIIPEVVFTVVDPAASPSPTPTATPTPTASPTPTATPVSSASPTPTATPTSSATPTPTPTATPTSSATPSPTATPVSSASPTPTATPITYASPTPSPAIGGTTYRQCNQSCSANTDCAANLRCYNNRCRLVTNVSNESCQEATVADNGLNRTCNQYCADSRECANGYTCYYNRCRNPYNLEATSCAAPSQQVFTAIRSSCNQACSSHKDCAANLLCNASTKTCRLAINPSSYSCTAATDRTVSTIYSSKGADLTGDANATQSGATGSMATTSPSPYKSSTYSADTTDGTTTSEDELPLKEQTALDSTRNFIQKQLADRGLNLPSIALAAGLILLIIIVLISILANVFKGGQSQPPIVVAAKRRQEEEKAKYEQNLSQKINSLTNQTKTASTGPAIPPTPVVGSQRTASAIQPVVTPQQATPVTPAVQPPPTLPTNQPVTSTTSMLNKLKDKGIQPPT